MWKKVFLASAVTGLLAGAAVPIHSTPAQAAAGCNKEAKVRYAGDAAGRKAFKHWCNNKWKLYKASAKGAPKA